jgi:hypothetical protein
VKPLCIELFAGTFGWSQGWHELGGYTVGFDIEHQPYHGPVPKGDDLVLQDVLTLHGSQFKDASLILASSPCQAYSYMAMPWSRAKQVARALRGEDVFPDGYEGYRTIAELNALFEAPRRIQREASEAAGRYIPMIQENVRGAIPWVGRSQWNFGSYHLWGDVPAMMPVPHKATKLGGGASWYPPSDPRHQPGLDFTRLAGLAHSEGQKVVGFRFDGSGKSFQTAAVEGVKTPGRSMDKGAAKKFGSHNMGTGEEIAHKLGIKHSAPGLRENGKGSEWFASGPAAHGSKSNARKAASAQIAKIPAPLARHIAQVYFPLSAGRSAQPHD